MNRYYLVFSCLLLSPFTAWSQSSPTPLPFTLTPVSTALPTFVSSPTMAGSVEADELIEKQGSLGLTSVSSPAAPTAIPMAYASVTPLATVTVPTAALTPPPIPLWTAQPVQTPLGGNGLLELKNTATPTAVQTPMATVVPSVHQVQNEFQWPVEVEVGLVMDLPSSGWQSAYTMGWGGQATLGYSLSPEWTVELEIDDLYYSGQNALGQISDTEVRLLPGLRYSLTLVSNLKVYGRLMVGLALDNSYTPQGSGVSTDMDMAAGLGVELQLAPRAAFFVEGKCNILLANGPNNSTVVGIDCPLTGGLRLDL